MNDSAKTEPTGVQRDARGRILKGSGAINGGGLTVEQRAARDAINLWLSDEPQQEAGREAYLALLKEKNPVIVKDFMDRTAGKVKDSIELSGDPERPFANIPTEQLLAALGRK